MQEMQEIQVQSLGGEDPLEKEMATHSSILAWKIPRTERGAWWATVHRAANSWTVLSEHKHTCLFFFNQILTNIFKDQLE